MKWALSFTVEETWPRRSCCAEWDLWVPPDKPSYLCNTWDSVVLHPSLAKWSTKGFVDTRSWVWVLTPLWAVWFLVLFWTSLNLSSLLGGMKVIPFTRQITRGGLNESVWLSEVSKVKLLPSSLAPNSSPFPLPSPPGSLGLLSYALSISCGSPETRLYSLFIYKTFLWPVLSFLPTSVWLHQLP